MQDNLICFETECRLTLIEPYCLWFSLTGILQATLIVTSLSLWAVVISVTLLTASTVFREREREKGGLDGKISPPLLMLVVSSL